MTRNTVARILLVLYALGMLAVTYTQLFGGPSSGDMFWTTSGKILAAATFALGFGAAMASRDPWQNRLVIQIIIVFMAGTTLAVVYGILTHAELPAGEKAPGLSSPLPRPPRAVRRVLSPATAGVSECRHGRCSSACSKPPGTGGRRLSGVCSPGAWTPRLGEAANDRRAARVSTAIHCGVG